jgi:hypothetical protein
LVAEKVPSSGMGFFYSISMFLMILAGFPPTTTLHGTSFVTTDPEAMTALSPIVTPGLMTARPPIQTLCPIVTGFPNSLPEFLSDGFNG